MFKKSFFILGALFFSLALATSFAADLEPYLQTLLHDGASTEFFSVLLDLKDQVDMTKLKSEFKATQADRAQSHKIVIESLKDKAKTSQTGLLNYLQAQKLAGEVADYKAFWLANLVWVKATKSEIEKLATRGDVETIYAQPKPEIIKPVEAATVAGPLVGVEPGIKAIKADSAWGLGYRGTGRLLCNIDTGVNGNHNALSGRWRGNNGGTVAESWFDPVYKNPFPVDNVGGVAGHGSATMGIMCGASLVTNDTVGVAIEAQWIAARAIDIGASWPVEIEALQWASDPDGNPNTITDVPDAVNNSWGIPTASAGCLPLYWNLIDNLEAAGSVVIFAAGNEGPSAQTLRNPANRATTDFNCFAVGSVNSSNVISGFSSRGPSDCDGISIKPEVVAPGELIRSTNRFGGYSSSNSGTSFSAPHVAGAVAILRQVNPNATVDEIKRALMVSATDYGTVGQDNSYGWGLINVRRAIDSLPAITDPRIIVFTIELSDSNDSIPDPGDNMSALITVKNTGLAATNVSAILSGTSGNVSVTQDSSFYGAIPQDGFAINFTQPYLFQVSSSALGGERLNLNLQIKGDGGYEENWPLVFYITAKPVRGLVDVDTGNVIFTISNFGQYGLSNISITPLGGKGFIYPKVGGTDQLFEGAFLIGTDISHVSDGARDWTGSVPDSDFAVAPQGDIIEISPGREGSQQTISIFNDEKAESPLNLKIVQRTFAFSDTANDDFVIFSFSVYNQNVSAINNLRLGFYTDWDMPSLQDLAGLNRSNNIGYMFHSSNSYYRGIAILDTVGVSSFKALANDPEVYDGVTDTEKYVWMSEGFIDTTMPSPQDGSMMIASGPYSIAPGDSITSIMAFVAANNLTNLLAYTDRARIKATELFPMTTCTHRAGDVTGDRKVLLTDIVFLINYLFRSGPTPNPFCRGDVNFDNAILLPDIVYLVNFIFRNGPQPVPYGQCCLGT